MGEMNMQLDYDRLSDDILKEIQEIRLIEKSTLYSRMEVRYNEAGNTQFSFGCHKVLEELKGYELISEVKPKWYSLTKDGVIASEMGLRKYLKRYKKNKDLEIQVQKTTIWNNKIAILLGGSSIISFIGGVLLSDLIKELLNCL